jgi:acyl-CoA reductase-like NAD-dependent aldehyde dehydrogenase
VAAGCTCVIKSAGQTSLPTETALRIASEIPTLPRGVLNLIAESGSRCGQRIVDSPDVDMVSYTGSTPVGKAIMAAGAATLKRLNLELGGNAPVLVLPTARIATAVEGIVRGALSYAGQVCVAASRIIVHQDIADQVRNALVERLKAHTPGMPKDPGARMGPLINRQSRERILSLQDSGGAGAINRLACSIPSHLPRSGGFITAGLIEVQDPASALMQDEVFGPLLSLTVCNNEREMAAVANRSRFGLAAGLWSEDLGQAQSLARDLRTGTVWINGHMRLFAEIETGGYKESGIGRLHGVEGLDAFLQSKHISWEMVIPAEK